MVAISGVLPPLQRDLCISICEKDLLAPTPALGKRMRPVQNDPSSGASYSAESIIEKMDKVPIF